MKQLILGGARSGKSKLAEQTARQLSEKQNKPLHYVATALPFDDEMRERIKHHQAQRGEGWHEHECHLRLPDLLAHFDANDVVLVD